LRGVVWEGCLLPMGKGSKEGAVPPPPPQKVIVFSIKMTCFGALWHYFE